MNTGIPFKRTVAQLGFDLRGMVHTTSTDLLVPEHLLAFALKISNHHGRWRDLIAHLLFRYRLRILRMATEGKNLRFRYQCDGLLLHRLSYLPYSATHAELRMLSYATRISMCALVVLMIEWEQEASREKEDNVVTMEFQCCWRLTASALSVRAAIQQETQHPPP